MLNRKTLIVSMAALGGLMAAMPAQAARNYDCSKAGNARLAVCKGAAPAAPALAAKPAAARPAPHLAAAARPAAAAAAVPHVAARPAAAPVTRAAPAPRMAARPASTNTNTVAWTTKTGKTVHYNCAKAGNTSKQACR